MLRFEPASLHGDGHRKYGCANVTVGGNGPSSVAANERCHRAWTQGDDNEAGWPAISRIALAYELGRNGFWLARWLICSRDRGARHPFGKRPHPAMAAMLLRERGPSASRSSATSRGFESSKPAAGVVAGASSRRRREPHDPPRQDAERERGCADGDSRRPAGKHPEP
jgi:hypothetical protein